MNTPVPSTATQQERPTVARLPRLVQILRALASAGWAHFVERLHPGQDVIDAATKELQPGERDAARFRDMLEQLGPAFVKFGQLLSLRRDLLPESWIEELQRLQDDVAAFSGTRAISIVERELGQPIGQLFSEFDDAPLAAASIGQVHGARLMDGTSVVVKVQRPGIEPVIHADVGIMRFIARQLERHVPESRRFGPSDLVEEFARLIADELDYQIEGRNGDRLRTNFANDPGIFVPRIYWALTSRRVLTMDRSLGHKLAQLPLPSPQERQRLAAALMASFLEQVFEHGFFHGDPHPGNVFVLADGRLCFHDFGIMGELSAHDQEALAQLILAVSSEDAALMVDAYLDMGVATASEDRDALKRDVSSALDAYYKAAGKGYSFSEIVRQFVQLSQKHDIRVPRQFLLVSKAFMLIEAQAMAIDSSFNALLALRDYVPRLLGRHAIQALGQAPGLPGVFRMLRSLHHAAVNLPDILNRAVDVLGSGKATLHVEHEKLQTLETHIDRASNRLSLSLIIASVVVGSSIVTTFHTGPHYAGISLLGLAGFVIAAVMGLAWAIAIFRSGRF
ncbi:TPA: ABC1 kinase family protein [Burkholderia contaminans]|uniref:ABC1 kinase family protein n=1 Tax=Burkholderia cepacia complex TaxID=87882 RepID=UPI000754020D|nr:MULTISPECIES: AarF/ABC1/UbiB kinase family protein [Burkholderia cepacia complex]KVS22047.1 ABC transporter [Burkholderia vietnamiensis]MBM6430554.1 AarF/ABC1/UbiB kinase family protein [Burkholderia contaminans]MCA7880863.1 AarF/ABC1/UbiB kinase family protein [Burkholderia contaminans]MDN8025813.1 AarF/ABC1/UbiB kinase family protein [Burkholderia contaminans]PRG04161.1 AarF/ABC1/UbiB kinase family protein [Burkholderia contaminans]